MPTPENSARSYVFLSYASGDRERALYVADVLEARGIPVWIDRKSIAGGSSWSAEIVEGLKGSAALVILCSAASMRSRNVQQEIQLAWEHDRKILPLLLEPVTLPSSIEYALAGRQWIEVLDRPDDLWLPLTLRALAGLGVPTAPTPAASPRPEPVVAAALTPEPRPTRSLTNLPVQATPFIGREPEVASACQELLRPEVRLLTLTGPGGVGKTRLSLAIGARVQTDFPDGVVFIPLAPVSDPSLVALAVAEVLGIRESGPRPMLDALKSFLGSKRCLLIFDNFEQITEAAGIVGQLLGVCSNLKVLVTSRSALHAYGEQLLSVEPLALPSPGKLPPLTQLAQFDAVQLFAERARAVKADFALSEENVGAVVEICRRLDGLPLAIELAAARVRLFPPAALLARLDSRLKLLTGGARDLPARQQTLRGAITWSHDLLDDDEKKLFRRLAVFVGGWTFEAAEAVSQAGGPLDLDVLDGLQLLIEKSLLRSEEGASVGSGEPRFGMLQTIREFALERLAESGEQTEAEWQHAAYFSELMDAAEPLLRSGQRGPVLTRLAPEQDNLRAILTRSAQSSDPRLRAAPIRIASPQAWFSTFHGNGTEGRKWIETALKNRANAPPADLGRALHGAGMLAWRLGDPVPALRYIEEALPLLRDSGNQDAYANASGVRCLLLGSVKGREAALAYRPEAEALMRASPNPWIRALCGRFMGMLDLQFGDYAGAEAALEESLHRYREVKDAWFVAQVLNSLGDLARARGDNAGAAAYYTEGLEIGRKGEGPPSIPSFLQNLGQLALRESNPSRARQFYAESIAIFQEQVDVRGILEGLAGLAGVLTAEGHPERAARLFGAVEALLAATSTTIYPSNQADYDHQVGVTRSALDPSSFATQWDDGKQLTLDQAVAFALADSQNQ
jgi:predicted ATPase